MIIDNHVHLLPDRLAQAVRRFFADHLGMVAWAYPTDHGEICARLAAEGVEEAWTLPYVQRPGTSAALNEATAAIAAAQSDGPVRIVAGATVHPADEDPADVVRRAVEGHGARVLKLHCSVGNFPADDPRLDPVWAYTSSIGLPTVIHAGHDISGRTHADEVAPIATVAGRWPEAPIIIAHCGHEAAADALDLVARHAHLYADLTPVVTDPVDASAAALRPVSDKILFGSDAPNTFRSVTQSLEWLRAMDLEPEVLAAITGGNARRLHSEVRA